MNNPEHRNFNPEQSEQTPEQVQKILDSARDDLEIRLDELEKNPYHNRKHAEEVVDHMKGLLKNLADIVKLTAIDRKLLIECAWRHDDGHSGKRYRQEAVGDVDGVENKDDSNEEHAVYLLREDLGDKLDEEQLKFMEDNILATSFGQNNKEALEKEGKEAYYRPYKPEIDSQKLLALADVSGFTKGWDEWVLDSMHLLEEAATGGPYNLINDRIEFATYIAHLLNETKKLLKPEYAAELRRKLDAINEHLDILARKNAEQTPKQN